MIIDPTRYQPSSTQLTVDKANALNSWQLSIVQVDKLVDSATDLVSPQYRAWYCSRLIRLGPDEFLKRADKARTGNFPPKLFSVLLKQR